MLRPTLKYLSATIALIAVKVALRDGDFYAMHFGKKRYQEINKKLVFFGLKGMGILNYKSPELSGEKGFLEKHLRAHDNHGKIVVDIGANAGQFAKLALETSSSLSVISFEPHPKACEKFENRMKDFSDRCQLVRKGASDNKGEAFIYDYKNNQGSEHASLDRDVIEKLHGAENSEKTKIELTTLDTELAALNKKICLLKIDTEGHELSVLSGAQKTIRNHRPSAILIEFNEMNALSSTHYCNILDAVGNNYLPYRLLPEGELLSLRGERPLWTEIYAFQNLVFLLAD